VVLRKSLSSKLYWKCLRTGLRLEGNYIIENCTSSLTSNRMARLGTLDRAACVWGWVSILSYLNLCFHVITQRIVEQPTSYGVVMGGGSLGHVVLCKGAQVKLSPSTFVFPESAMRRAESRIQMFRRPSPAGGVVEGCVVAIHYLRRSSPAGGGRAGGD